MKHRFAFAGFRHTHIDELYTFAKEHESIDIVGAAEDDRKAAKSAKRRGINITDKSIDALFDRADDFDVVAIGDYFGRRGDLAIRALQAGKHVIADKPLCTSIDELCEIDQLHRRTGLAVGCMLNNRDAKQFITMKRLVGDRAVGEIRTINFMGQHPLLHGSRPSWYFEEGKHGGTINDIAIHAIDIIPWFTGDEWNRVLAARVWNDRLPKHPHFQVCAQMMLELSSGIGVLGDVSYLSPDSQGYAVPQYWRYTIHGDEGILETGMQVDDVSIWKNGSDTIERVPSGTERSSGVYEDFVREIEGRADEADLTSPQVIASARMALLIQQSADRKQYPIELS